MAAPEEIQQVFNQLSPEAQRKAQEAGAYQEALATGNVAPLQSYLSSPSGMGIADTQPAPPPPSLADWKPLPGQEPENWGTVQVGAFGARRPPGWTSDTGWSPTIASDEAFVNAMMAPDARNAFYTSSNVFGGVASGDAGQGYAKNIAEGDKATGQSIAKAAIGVDAWNLWVSMGKPPLYDPNIPQELQQARHPGGMTTTEFARRSTGEAEGKSAYAPQVAGNIVTLTPPVQYGGGVLQPIIHPTEAERGEGGGTSRKGLTIEEYGQQLKGYYSGQGGGTGAGNFGPAGPTAPPAHMPDIPLIPRSSGAPIIPGADYNPENPANVFSEPFAPSPVREAPLGTTPAGGYKGADILSMEAGGIGVLGLLQPQLAQKEAFQYADRPKGGEMPIGTNEAWARAELNKRGIYYEPALPIAVAGLSFLMAAEGLRAGAESIAKDFLGYEPVQKQAPLPSAISADARRFMEGGITKTETSVVPVGLDDAVNRARIEAGLAPIKETKYTQTTYSPFVDGTVTVKGDGNIKDVFAERLMQQSEEYRTATVNIPFTDRVLDITAKKSALPLVDIYKRAKAGGAETFDLGNAPGRFAMGAVGLGVAMPLEFAGTMIMAAEKVVRNPLEAGLFMASSGPSALALGAGSLAVTAASAIRFDPAYTLGGVAGLYAGGRIAGARTTTEQTGFDIQFPRGSGGDVPLIEVPTAGVAGMDIALGGRMAERIQQSFFRSKAAVYETEVARLEVPMEWVERPTVAGAQVDASALMRGLKVEQRLNIDLSMGRTAEMQVPGDLPVMRGLRSDYARFAPYAEIAPIVGQVAKATEELVPSVPFNADFLNIVRVGRESEVGLAIREAELFTPASREGRAFIEEGPLKGISQPVYETVQTAEPWMRGTKDLTTVDVAPPPKNLLYHGSQAWEAGSELPLYLAFSREWAAGFAKMGPKGGEGSVIKAFQLKSGTVGIDISELSKAGIDISEFGPQKIRTVEYPLDFLNTTPNYLDVMTKLRNKGIDVLFDKNDPRQLIVTNPDILIEYTESPQVSTKYPTVRPQNLLEKVTRRPAEEIKLVSQKKLLGYLTPLREGTSETVRGYMMGRATPKGAELRIPSKGAEIISREALPGLTPNEARSRLTYGEANAPLDVGLTEGAKLQKGGPYIGGIGAKADLVYDVKAGAFGDIAKALEKSLPGARATAERLVLPFGQAKTSPSIFDFPVSKLRGATVKVVPSGLQSALGNLARKLEPSKKGVVRPWPKEVQFPEEKRLLGLQGGGKKGAKASSGGLGSLSRGREATLADLETAQKTPFEVFVKPRMRSRLSFGDASRGLLGVGVGLAGISEAARGAQESVTFQSGKAGTSQFQLESSKLAEQVRTTFQLPQPKERDRQVPGNVDITRQRDRPVVGIRQGGLERLLPRVTQRSGTTQITSEMTKLTPKYTPTETPRFPPGGPPGRPGQPPPGFPIPTLGGFAMPRPFFRGYRPSLKITPIATLESMFSFGGGAKRGGRKVTGAKRGRPKGSKTKKRGGKK